MSKMPNKGPKKKIDVELKKEEDGTVLVPKEVVENIQISETTLKQKVKREMTEAQKANLQRLIEANRKKWEEKKKQKEEESKKLEEAKKAEVEQKLKSGDLVKVQVKPKRVVKKPKVVVESLTEDTLTETETPTETETETETDIEEYKQKARKTRREVKKNIKAIEKIDKVIEKVQNTNPYLDLLAKKWK